MDKEFYQNKKEDEKILEDLNIKEDEKVLEDIKEEDEKVLEDLNKKDDEKVLEDLNKNEDEKVLENLNIKDEKVDIKIIILHTKSISSRELDIFRRYGPVLNYNHKIYAGLSIDMFQEDFKFLFIDVRKDYNNQFYLSIPNRNKYKIIAYISFYEINLVFLDNLLCDNIIKTLPEPTAFVEDYIKVLLTRRIVIPNIFESGVSFFINKVYNPYQIIFEKVWNNIKETVITLVITKVNIPILKSLLPLIIAAVA